MLDYFSRQQLHRKGLSCGKKRREQSQSDWVDTLRFSPFIRLLIACFFLAGLGTLTNLLPPDSGYHYLQSLPGQTPMGMVLLLATLGVSMVHFSFYLQEYWQRNSRVLLIYVLLAVQLGLTHLVEWLLRLNNHGGEGWELICIPYAVAPIMLTLLLDARVGMFGAVYGSLFGALLVPQPQSWSYLVLSLGVGIIAVLCTRNLRKRSKLMWAGLWVALATLIMGTLLQRLGLWSELWHGRGWEQFGIFTAVILLAGLGSATVVGGLLPIFEGLFRITTTISWIELADLNHPLLRRMTLEAPGSYHHSLMVASLAESAAEAIGANPTQCRVCAYFHDIGKVLRPQYCIENNTGEEDAHAGMLPNMSALIIISHVKDGVDLAIKHKLNREIIDVIQQHHGTSLVYFFYRKALDQRAEIESRVKQGLADEKEIPEVAEENFRYPGPKPHTAESAIISLADAVESASRVLAKPTLQRIEQLVDDIVAARLKDGQLDECDLTMADLLRIRESFVTSLRNILHRRVEYPKEKEAKAERTEKAEKKPREDAPTASPGTPSPALLKTQQS